MIDAACAGLQIVQESTMLRRVSAPPGVRWTSKQQPMQQQQLGMVHLQQQPVCHQML